MIRKGAIKDELWKTILAQSMGTINEKVEACKLIFDNYRNVPAEADNVLKRLAASTEHEDVRKIIASEMVQKTMEIPYGIYTDLLIILSKDSNQEIKWMIKPQYDQFIKPLLNIAEITQRSLNATLETANKFIEYSNQAIIHSMSSISKVFSEVSEIFEEPDFESFEYNWLGFLSIDQLIKMYEIHKTGKDMEIEEGLIKVNKDKYLEGFLNEMKESDIFKHRIPIIQDAIRAHEEGKFSLSIPVLLAQIEGILWGYAEKQDLNYGDKIITKSGEAKNLESVKLLLKETIMKDQLFKYINQEYLNKIYVEKFRHGILHGRITNYNTEKNSMKLLLFLRALLEDCRRS